MLPEILAFQHWLRRKFPHSTTATHYTSDLKLFFRWAGKAPQHIHHRDINNFIDHCLEQGHAINTINRRLAALRGFYKFLAFEVDDPLPNPVIPKRHFIRKGRSLPRDVSDGDLAALFACIDQPRDRAMFTLMLRCGLRVGEVHSLSMPDLSLTPSPGMLPRLWIHGKGSIERVAYLSPQAYSALVSWLAVRPAGQSRAVFLNKFGRRISVTGIQDRLAKYCRLAGLWVTCHQLRHTFGRHLTEAHVPVTTIQVLMGHARIRSTEVYLHISNTQVQAEYELAITAINQRMTLLGSTP